MGVIEFLDEADQQLFILIHSKAAFTFLDPLMLFLRKPEAWIPLYVALLAWIVVKKRGMALPFILCSLLTFAVTDFGSASIFKPIFYRPRPCYDENLRMVMRSLLNCGGRFGFPSSHASNHFGLACFWFTTIELLTGRRWFWLWLWAALICYAQIYVGKHYPLDIAAGALFGMITGFTVHLIFGAWMNRNNLFSSHSRRKFNRGAI
ncbi:phosphatase PAP2 family protein [Segetibacter sp. 3557_3]|uniref:phosphatase PAP2 family protein n=1 Tax=Segetibacter sp. 3557_3 TaxID=2547429 RepID=UPI00105888E7|nr:phosphatase PAP2 family protein [Segetibacter sp. 3557_3]TDH27018.1 phosphatase PAP2 family protein [Segetibacter sp. 3557_3]